MALTKKMIYFCIEYVQSRNASESAIKAGYSVSYAQKKAYLLLENEDVQERISEIEQTYFDDGFKKLSLVALKELNNVICDGENRSAQLRGIMYILNAVGATPEPEDRPKQKVIFEVLIPPEYAEYGIE